MSGSRSSYWADILASGILPPRIRMIGFGGGSISAAEYRIALLLGAKVGIIENSGRAAEKLLADKHWNRSKNLIVLPYNGEALKRFLVTGTVFHTKS